MVLVLQVSYTSCGGAYSDVIGVFSSCKLAALVNHCALRVAGRRRAEAQIARDMDPEREGFVRSNLDTCLHAGSDTERNVVVGYVGS